MPTDREKGIDFTTMRNVIKFCALSKIEPFSFEFIAEKMNTDPAFLRYWNQNNQGLISKVIEMYPKEIDQEVSNLRSENNERD